MSSPKADRVWNARYLKLADLALRPKEPQRKTASTWVKSDNAEPRTNRSIGPTHLRIDAFIRKRFMK